MAKTSKPSSSAGGRDGTDRTLCFLDSWRSKQRVPKFLRSEIVGSALCGIGPVVDLVDRSKPHPPRSATLVRGDGAVRNPVDPQEIRAECGIMENEAPHGR